MRTIYFDMDGTIADLYGVDGWLDSLIAEETKPYREAKSLCDMRKLGKELNRVQALGYRIAVLSWLSRGGSAEYGERVAETKVKWLAHHLGAVRFDEIHIVEYGYSKNHFCNGDDILFDDEERNRTEWSGIAYAPEDIFRVLGDI